MHPPPFPRALAARAARAQALRPLQAGLLACLGVGALVGLGAGCDRPTVAVRLVFPSEQTFLASALARLDVYDGGGTGERSPDAICRSLSVTPPTPPQGVAPIASISTDVCDFRAGGVDLRDVGVGRRVFFVEAQDFSGQAILRGCAVEDVYGDAQQLDGDDAGAAKDLGANGFVEVQLATLPEFPAEAPTCASVEEKCEENTACTQ